MARFSHTSPPIPTPHLCHADVHACFEHDLALRDVAPDRPDVLPRHRLHVEAHTPLAAWARLSRGGVLHLDDSIRAWRHWRPWMTQQGVETGWERQSAAKTVAMQVPKHACLCRRSRYLARGPLC
eukprot:8897-Chlamydomonas_euryale.AAC.1